MKTSETISILQHSLKGLVEGNIYEFRVSAENKAGVGPASDPTKPVKIEEPLGMFIFVCPCHSYVFDISK